MWRILFATAVDAIFCILCRVLPSVPDECVRSFTSSAHILPLSSKHRSQKVMASRVIYSDTQRPQMNFHSLIDRPNKRVHQSTSTVMNAECLQNSHLLPLTLSSSLLALQHRIIISRLQKVWHRTWKRRAVSSKCPLDTSSHTKADEIECFVLDFDFFLRAFVGRCWLWSTSFKWLLKGILRSLLSLKEVNSQTNFPSSTWYDHHLCLLPHAQNSILSRPLETTKWLPCSEPATSKMLFSHRLWWNAEWLLCERECPRISHFTIFKPSSGDGSNNQIICSECCC